MAVHGLCGGGISDAGLIKRIYQRLGDDISKTVFTDRLLYSLTQDRRYVMHMVRELPEAGEFYRFMEQIRSSGSGAVIFGAGSWGKELYRMTDDYPWKCFIDSKSGADRFEGLPVVAYKDFVENYRDEFVVISSRVYHGEMYRQLVKSKIAHEKIINMGQLLDKWAKKQYFDLDELIPGEEEGFVDAGSLDGMTSMEFMKWCAKSDRKTVYAFEPDKENIGKCRKTLSAYGRNCEIIAKGCWSEETSLQFQVQGNGNSAINPDGGEVIETTTIDRALEGKKVTFIKMDIEGAELNALYGAKDTIMKNNPRLAICVYHKPEDIWEIPSAVLRFHPGYKLYLRHYSLTDSETVLYALPQGNESILPYCMQDGGENRAKDI